jgi:dihydrofolate reductase
LSINLIAAIGLDGEIGYKGKLLAKLPADMKHFRELTDSHFVIMGRKTYDEIGKPLPNRTNIVLSSKTNHDYHPDINLYSSVDDVLFEYEHYADKQVDIFVCGGSKVYEAFMKYADFIYLTVIHNKFKNADRFFPKFDISDWKVIEHTDHPADEQNQCPYSFITYQRK